MTNLKYTHTLCAIALLQTSIAKSAIIINEVDYDQPGSDIAEFVELYNNGTESVSLENYHLQLINGSNNSIYRNIDLTGYVVDAGNYFVICDNGSLIQNCNYAFTNSSGWIQNGAPDAVALFNSTGDQIDALSYEGIFANYTEGDTITVKDSNSIITSLSRLANGIDSNDNFADFELGCITPGSENIAGSGDCSIVAVSAVPLPASAWLFASGLVGLIGIRRRH